MLVHHLEEHFTPDLGLDRNLRRTYTDHTVGW